jgi:hypothetical protein
MENEAWLHSFLISTEGGEWIQSHHNRFPPKKEPLKLIVHKAE